MACGRGEKSDDNDDERSARNGEEAERSGEKTQESGDVIKLLRNDEITEIRITSAPEFYDMTITDRDEIERVREYFDSLDLEVGDDEIKYMNIMILDVTYADNTTEKISCCGNVFMKDKKDRYKANDKNLKSFEKYIGGVEIFSLARSDERVDDFLDEIESSEDGSEQGAVKLPSDYEDDECFNATPEDISEKYGFDIFKFDESCASYLMYDGEIYPLGEYFGGSGVNEFMLADLDKDGQNELYFTYSWGSGMHRSQVGSFNFVTKKTTLYTYSNYDVDMKMDFDCGRIYLYNVPIGGGDVIKTLTANNGAVGVVSFKGGDVEYEYFFMDGDKFCSRYSEKEVR